MTCARWASVPEVVVGLCMQRCFGLVVGLLAIFKAGGAFLPLDPAIRPSGCRRCWPMPRPAVVLAQRRSRTGCGRSAIARRLKPSKCRTMAARPLPRSPCPIWPTSTRPDQSGLPDLHLRLHRHAQGRAADAWRLEQPRAVDERRARADAQATACCRRPRSASTRRSGSSSRRCAAARRSSSRSPTSIRTCVGWPTRFATTTSASSSSCRPNCA